MLLKVGILQFAPDFGKTKENLDRMLGMLKKAPESDLIVCPELAISGYLFTDKKELSELAFEVPESEIFQEFKKLSQEKRCAYVVGFPERKNNKFYNSAFYILPDGKFGVYQKVHLFFEEKNFFVRGNKMDTIFNLKGAKIGIMICFDWYFPEAARTYALKGVHILAHPANLVLPWGQKAMIIRSLENKIWTISANRLGEDLKGDKRLKFTGKSQIVSPEGKILLNFNSKEEGVKIIGIDPFEAENKNITPLNNFVEDRKKDCYSL